MNLKTITFDADKWQLMPRAVNPNMSKAAEIVYCSWLNKQSFKDDKMIIRYLFDALLAAAPQPETVAPVVPDKTKKLYEELIYSVASKFPDETRHQTAMRYIRNAEKGTSTHCDAMLKGEK